MHEQKYKIRWSLVLALGLIAVAIGFLINIYAIAIVQKGPFPAISGSYQISGFFFIGLGMGYLVLTPLVKYQYEKIRKLEKELPNLSVNKGKRRKSEILKLLFYPDYFGYVPEMLVACHNFRL